MALLNSIGTFDFLDLKGEVQTIGEEVELLKRPGVPGVGAMLTGVRGAPFRVRSRVDAFSLADANNAYINYQSYRGGVYDVVQYGCDFSESGFGFLVLNVEKVVLRAQMFFMGGLFPPSLAWLEADWTLCCVALDQSGGNE